MSIKPYTTFQELLKNESEGKDFQIRFKSTDSGILIMAPHGGRIEPGTTEIAESLASGKYSFYSFEGLKFPDEANIVLHVGSADYDEPIATKMISAADLVITIHGFKDSDHELVILGGFYQELKTVFADYLNEAGFVTRLAETENRFFGSSPENICNRGRIRKGVQFELSRKLRDALVQDKNCLNVFTGIINEAIGLFVVSG